MSKTLTTALLGLYFFFYLLPQNIDGIYTVYDRLTIQIVFLAILNIVVFLVLIKKREINSLFSLLKKNNHIISYLLFIIIATVSIIVAVNKVESIVSLSKFTTFFISFIFIIYLANKKNINFLKLFISFSVISVFIESYSVNSAIYDSVISNGKLLGRSMEYRGFTGNPNITSFAIAIKIPVLIYLLLNNKNKFIIGLTAIIFSFSLLSIIALFSRAAMIALSLIFFFTILFVILKRNTINLKRFALIILAVVSSYWSYDFLNEKNTTDLIIDRFSNITEPSIDESVNERLGFYKIALEDIKNNPILGVGIGNWKLISIQRANSFLKGYRIPYRVHNDFLEVTAEIGILGGLCFFYFIFYPFVYSFKKIFNKDNFNVYALIFLIVGVYIVDSMLNFPMNRAIMIIYLFFAFALFNNKKQEML